ncbi:vacuolar protein sorting-associated protein 16 [Atractiella rhizophila]|nr:vacuolar protein sorting-associated protein 16 [Atractiella rhizophila]
MARPPPSSNWDSLGGGATFYRKLVMYEMGEDWTSRVGQDLGSWRVVGERGGGLVAVTRDDRKPTILRTGLPPNKRQIWLFTSAGGLVTTLHWDSPTPITYLSFLSTSQLFVLTTSGTYRLYNISPLNSTYSQYELAPEIIDAEAGMGIVDVKGWEEGVVVCLEGGGWIEVRGLGTGDEEEGRRVTVQALASTGSSEPPHSWGIIPPDQSTTRTTEVLLATRDTVLKLDEIEALDQQLTRGPFSALVPSPNGRFIALITSPISPTPDTLWVVSADFSRSLSEFDLAKEGRNLGILGEESLDGYRPNMVQWCGDNSVVLGWDNVVVMVGPFGETLRYFYTDPIHLVPELDGVRLLSSDRCEFIEKVPQSTVDVFLPGSTHPAAFLFEASEEFRRKSARADELIRAIKPELTSAVETCVEAAGREFDIHWQKSLLRAASFGKTFLDLYNPSDFVNMSKTLRVLNAVRYYEMGIPITFAQYQSLSPTTLITRLMSLSHHLLALRISTFLSLSPSPVLKHWAKTKISSARTKDEEDFVVTAIVDKLKEQQEMEVSCADVAKSAWTAGKTAMAKKLLDYEVKAGKQVPLLMSMKEEDLALTKAVDSGDPDLVYLVLLQLKRNHSLANFFQFFDNKPDAASLLQAFGKDNDLELLRDFYYQDDRRTESACLLLEEAELLKDESERTTKLKSASKFFGEEKDRTFEQKMVDEQLKLLTQQQKFESESSAGGKKFVGLSVNQTIRQLLVNGMSKQADKVKSDFKVPDKRFWYIKMKALTEIHDWEALEAFSKSKKSPIGYEPFAEHLVSTANFRHAVSYIPRCEPKNRVELYVKCGEWIKAGEECKARGERSRLNDLRKRAPSNNIAVQLDRMAEEMAQLDAY